MPQFQHWRNRFNFHICFFASILPLRSLGFVAVSVQILIFVHLFSQLFVLSVVHILIFIYCYFAILILIFVGFDAIDLEFCNVLFSWNFLCRIFYVEFSCNFLCEIFSMEFSWGIFVLMDLMYFWFLSSIVFWHCKIGFMFVQILIFALTSFVEFSLWGLCRVF